MKNILIALISLTLCSVSTAAIQKGGVSFKDSIKLKKQKLVLNGIGIREATILNIDVYVAGLYLTKKTKSAKAILNSKSPKYLKMKFVRDVKKSDLNGAWDDSLKSAAIRGKFKKEFLLLKKSMTDMKKGSNMAFAFGKTTTFLLINGKRKATFKGRKFATALLNVWLGKKPPNRGLKAGMLGIN